MRKRRKVSSGTSFAANLSAFRNLYGIKFLLDRIPNALESWYKKFKSAIRIKGEFDEKLICIDNYINIKSSR